MPNRLRRPDPDLIGRRITRLILRFLAPLGMTVLLFFTLSQPTFAQTVTSDSAQQAEASQSATTVTLTPMSPQYANILIINLIHTFSCFAEGASIIGQPCVTLAPASDNEQGMVPAIQNLADGQGALGAVNNFMTNMYYAPPVRVSEYVADEANTFGFATPAFAQVAGSGNQVLQPVLAIWKVLRNIAYLGLIVILLVIGLMIMFRQKINPQTVISAQAALPSLIVGLIMITFSYFIAAVLVDMTFVTTHLAGHVLEGQIIVDKKVPDSNPKDPNNPPSIDPIENLLKNYSILSIYNFFIDGNTDNTGLQGLNTAGGTNPLDAAKNTAVKNGQIIKNDATGTINPQNGVSGQAGALIDPTNAIGETQSVVNSLTADHSLGSIISEASFAGGCIVGNQLGITSGVLGSIQALGDAAELIPVEGEGAKNGLTLALKQAARVALKPVAKAGKVAKNTGNVIQKIPLAQTGLNCLGGGSIVSLLAHDTPIVGDLAGLILYLVLMLALIVAMFKLLFALIGAYISIMIATITAPLQFLMGSIPGRQSVISGWLKGMLANLLAFPAVFAALLFAAYIVNWNAAPFYMDLSVAPNFNGGTLPLLGGLSSGFLRLVLAYGILLACPTIPQMVKGAMGVKEGGLDFTKAAMGGIGAGWGVLSKGYGSLTHNFGEERKQVIDYYKHEKVFGPESAEKAFHGRPEAKWYEPWKRFGTGYSELRERRYAADKKKESDLARKATPTAEAIGGDPNAQGAAQQQRAEELRNQATHGETTFDRQQAANELLANLGDPNKQGK